MATQQRFRHFYEFGPFRLDAEKHWLFHDGELVHLSPKYAEALVVLVQNAGKLLERETLILAVWSDSFVEDANLTVAISHLRKVLGQNGETAEYIETIPRIGYRFVAEVRETYEEPKPLIIEKHTQSRTVIEEEFLPDYSTDAAAMLTVQPKAAVATALPLTTQRNVLIATATLVIIVVASLLYWRRGDEKASAATSLGAGAISSIAVLPPKRLTDQSEDASLSLGIADALITRLGSMNKLTVRPTSAIARYVDSNQDVIGIGRALNVDSVLDGTLQRDHGRMRVTLRLLNVASGRQVWTDNFDEADSDIFKLQDSISQRVGSALYSDLTRDELALLTRQQTTNKEAYALYLQGNYFWNKRGNEVGKSIEYFRKAIERDPDFAQAYVGLAAAEATAARAPEAEALIEKALQLDPTSAEAHATLGFIEMFLKWDWANAEKELDRALELNPNSVVAHHWKGVYLSIRGRLDEAKAEMQRALDLDPLSLIIMSDLGQLYYFSHEYDRAAEYCNRALTFDPEFYEAHRYLVDIYRMRGMGQEAFNQFVLAGSIDPRTAAALKAVFAREGLPGVFSRYLQLTLNSSSVDSDNRTLNALEIGYTYCLIGNKEQALKWIAIGVEKPQSFGAAYLSVDPVYDFLRTDPRFNEILHRINLT